MIFNAVERLMNTEEFVRRQIQRILAEGEEKPKEKPKGPGRGRKKKKKGGKLDIKYGSGDTSADIKGSKARVESDPGGLLGDLGVKAGKGSDLERMLGIVRSAIYGTDVMSAAYVGANVITRQDGMKMIQIAVKAIKPRDGVFFMAHVFTAAESVGMVGQLEQNVRMERGGDGVVITFG
jgi:hypothetical protein